MPSCDLQLRSNCSSSTAAGATIRRSKEAGKKLPMSLKFSGGVSGILGVRHDDS